MEINPPPPVNNPPAPQVVVVKKRGCLGWLGLGVVGFIGLLVVAFVLIAALGSGSSDDTAQVQSIASGDDAESVETEASIDADADADADADGAPSEPAGPDGSRSNPWPAGSTVDITWDVFGDADGSVWTTTIGDVTDITEQVLAENEFNDAPPEGAIFAAFPVEMTLVSADKEPLSAGFNLSFEIHGVANVYDALTLDTIGCGVTPNDFDAFSEVFTGGTVKGVVCIPIPADELADATAVIKFGDDRIWFD